MYMFRNTPKLYLNEYVVVVKNMYKKIRFRTPDNLTSFNSPLPMKFWIITN